jgi:hypothetical protein
MFQAISYAGMVAKWRPEDFLGYLDADRREKLLDFLEVEKEEINRHQRIILIAEAFDFSVLVGGEWLSEQFGVDIICCRLSLAKDATTDTEFLVCSNLFPAPELAQQAIRRGRGRSAVSQPKWPDWDAALANVGNAALVAFYKKELDAGQENYLRKRYLRYRVAGKRRWFVAARRRNAYVWQHARFDGDIDFWRGGLSRPDQVRPVKDGGGLSFSLFTDQDFQFFRQAATQKLLGVKWTETAGDDEEAEGDGQPDGTE